LNPKLTGPGYHAALNSSMVDGFAQRVRLTLRRENRPDRISFPFGLGAILARGEAYVLRKINEI